MEWSLLLGIGLFYFVVFLGLCLIGDLIERLCDWLFLDLPVPQLPPGKPLTPASLRELLQTPGTDGASAGKFRFDGEGKFRRAS